MMWPASNKQQLGWDCSVPTTQPETLRRPSKAVTSPHRLGRAIRQARTELGWTQAELANRTGVARAQISAIETARANPKAATLIELLRALDCEIEIHPVDRSQFNLDDHLNQHVR